MNFKGTKKLYIIKTCEKILYFNSIKHHIQFQYNCRGWRLGVGHYPQKISSGWPCSMFLALPNFDQPMWFSLPYFGPDPKFYPQFQTRSSTLLSTGQQFYKLVSQSTFWLVMSFMKKNAIKLTEFREGCLLVKCFKSVIIPFWFLL